MYRIFADGEVANSSSSESSEQPLGILPHQIRGSLSQFSQMTLVGHSSNNCTACSSTVSLACSFDYFFLAPLIDPLPTLSTITSIVLYMVGLSDVLQLGCNLHNWFLVETLKNCRPTS